MYTPNGIVIFIHTTENTSSVYDPNLKMNIINLNSSYLKARGKHLSLKKWIMMDTIFNVISSIRYKCWKGKLESLRIERKSHRGGKDIGLITNHMQLTNS